LWFDNSHSSSTAAADERDDARFVFYQFYSVIIFLGEKFPADVGLIMASVPKWRKKIQKENS
jgi:hypothetical protein